MANDRSWLPPPPEFHQCACGCMCNVVQRTNRAMLPYVAAVKDVEALILEDPGLVDPRIREIVADARRREEEAG